MTAAIIAAGAVTKNDIGLVNVDNTADSEKPVSAIQQAAIDSAAVSEVWDRFDDKSNGIPTTAHRGTWSMHGGPVGQSAKPTVVAGKLTSSIPGTVAAGYAQLSLSKSMCHISARFTLSSYSTNQGAATFGAWSTDINATWPVIPDSPCHLAIGATVWIYGVWTGNVFTQVASGTFATPLAANGTTQHTAEVYIDKANAIAYIFLPDGTTATASHSLIGSVSGSVAFWEYYRQATTDTLAAFTNVSADSQQPLGLLMAKVLTTIPANTVETFIVPSTSMSVLIPGSSMTDVGQGTTVTFFAPRSGKVKVQLSGFIQINAAALVFWQLAEGATAKATWTVADGQIKTRATVDCVVTGLVPGSSYTYKWQHMSTTPNIGYLMLDNPNGYSASMTVTPL